MIRLRSATIRRGPIEYTIARDGDFAPDEIRRLEHRRAAMAWLGHPLTEPLGEEWLAAILAVKRVLGGRIVG
jgi:hypothetical protein